MIRSRLSPFDSGNYEGRGIMFEVITLLLLVIIVMVAMVLFVVEL
jgi:hypothetical protein